MAAMPLATQQRAAQPCWAASIAPPQHPQRHHRRSNSSTGGGLHQRVCISSLSPGRPCLLHHCSSAGQASHLRMWQSRAIATSAPPALEHHHSTPLHRATVLSNRREALGLHVMLLDVGAQLAALHKRPGQYLQAQLAPSDAQAGFFAITSPPGGALPAGVVELLVKAQPGAVAERICALPPGAQLWVSPPQGQGFPVERIPASDVDTVLLFATGTGISPIKAVIESGVLEVHRRREVRLYYGSRTQEMTAYRSLIPAWTLAGIKVVQVLSAHNKQYVQGAFAEDAPQLIMHARAPERVGVLLCVRPPGRAGPRRADQPVTRTVTDALASLPASSLLQGTMVRVVSGCVLGQPRRRIHIEREKRMSHTALSSSSSSRLLPAAAAHSSRSALIPIVRLSTTRASPSAAAAHRDAACTATAPLQPSHHRQHVDRAGRSSLVVCSSSASSSASTATATSLPPLQPLNDDYERKHTFGDFANWLIPGVVMLGRYPYCEPSRCTSYDKGEAQLEKIVESGITTFVSLQAEVPAQAQMTLAGVDGFLPYKATAELIKSAHSPPPSMEVMMNLRNPTLDKFLPPKKRQASDDKPSYELQFVHFPIVDLAIPDAQALEPFVQELIARVAKGEKLYIHCWGGRGRAGTVGAYLLGKAYGISADEALERVQRAFNTRQDNKERSPETEEQIAFVRALLA